MKMIPQRQQLLFKNQIVNQQMRSFAARNRNSIRIGRNPVSLGFCVVVPENYAVLLHRFDGYSRTVEGGIHFKIPGVDQIGFWQDLREQVFQIDRQSAITSDNVALDIDGVLYLQVVDSYKASYGVEQWQQAMINLAQTTMRSEIGRLPLDSLFAEREVLNEKIVAAI